MDRYCCSAQATTTTSSSSSSHDHGNNAMIQQSDEKNPDKGPSSTHPFSAPDQSQSFLPLSQSRHQHPNESNFYPFVFPSGFVTPPIFPVYPLGFDHNVADAALPTSSMGAFFDGGFSDKQQIGGNGLEYPCFPEPLLFSTVQVQKQLDSWITKAARSKRRIARQMSSCSSSKFGCFNRVSSATSPSCSTSGSSATKNKALYSDSTQNSSDNEEIYTFITPDNKQQKLKILLQKELKNSDVTNLGRIVLPKREAEAHLPKLTVKEGIQLPLREVFSTRIWHMRYRFWPNNKSRMYVLENTGDFVRTHDLKVSDSIILYRDEGKIFYIAFRRAEEKSTTPGMDEAKEKELEEQLKQGKRKEEDTIKLSLQLGCSSSVTLYNKTSNNVNADATATNQPAMVPLLSKDKGQVGIDYDDDCFSELGMLPNFNDKDFSL